MHHSHHKFAHVDLLSDLLRHPIYRAIIRSKTFSRLKGISFLGAIDYITAAHKRDNRYNHSLSVGALALLYARLRSLDRIDQDHLVAAALLHDIGHGPLSHSMEPVFNEKYGLSHHTATKEIITGHSPLGQELSTILLEYKIDRVRILSLLEGKANDSAAFALNSPINIDTADAIIRAQAYISSGNEQKRKASVLLRSGQVIRALVDKDHAVLDAFWKLKNKVYNDFIHNQANLVADTAASSIARQCVRLDKKDFFLTEHKFESKHSVSLAQLNNISNIHHQIKTLNLKKRYYHIAKKQTLTDDGSVYIKYKCTMKPCTITL